MLERLNPILRLVCIALAGLVVWQAARLTMRREAFGGGSLLPMATNSAATQSVTMAANAPLPPEVAAIIEKIKNSQLLGPEMRPPPMALLAIAGQDVFLRAANGQTGLIREGEELGGIKLLKIGTNRVLVEHEGQQKELMIFSGFGGESLIKKEPK
ncbi:MAG TPA: hypothetical protein VEH27_16940 [Methylomirabilota bacterium]|nr:hypothetical protein [Methylomirabilota bacterium]